MGTSIGRLEDDTKAGEVGLAGQSLLISCLLRTRPSALQVEIRELAMVQHNPCTLNIANQRNPRAFVTCEALISVGR